MVKNVRSGLNLKNQQVSKNVIKANVEIIVDDNGFCLKIQRQLQELGTFSVITELHYHSTFLSF